MSCWPPAATPTSGMRETRFGCHRSTRENSSSTPARLSKASNCSTSGGRVLNAVGIGASREEARRRAYGLADRIRFSGKQYRTRYRL